MSARSEATGSRPEAAGNRGFDDPQRTVASRYSFGSPQVTHVAKIAAVLLHEAGISLRKRSPRTVLRGPHHTTRAHHTVATPHATSTPHGRAT